MTYAELTESPDYKLRIRISELVELVKKAFKEKRRQDCTAIAKTILELDPQNDDARFILSWIECDLERDLQLARALLPDLKNDERLYKNAQVIVQTVLETDPGNKAAEALRLEIESAFQSFESDQADLLQDPTIDEIANVAAVIDAAADASLDALDFVPAESPSASVWDPEPSLESATEPTPVPEVEYGPENEPQVQSMQEAQPRGEVLEPPLETHEPPKTPLMEPSPEPESEAHSVTDTEIQQEIGPAEQTSVQAPAPQPQLLPPPQLTPPPQRPPMPELKFQPPRPPNRGRQAQVHPFARERSFPQRKRKRSYIVIGLVLVGAGILIRTTGLPNWPNWFAIDRNARGIKSDSSNTSKQSAPIPTSPAPTRGDLEIVIDEGVELFINDQYAGKAPVPPISLRPGDYELRYKLDQTDLGAEKVTVAAGQIARNSIHGVLGSLEVFVLPSSGTVMQIDDNPAAPVEPHLVLKPGKHRLIFTAAGYQPQTLSASVAPGRSSNLTVVMEPVIIGPTPRLDSSTPAPTHNIPSSTSSNRNNASPAAGGKGTLAVSSLLPIDIYLDNNHLGTTPVTLELPSGTYTFEYRYGNLRKSGVNVIKSNELTRATVVFEATLQINSTPAAEVSIAGIQSRVLGQTPLTSVRLPIGSTLLFRTPGYSEKSYTVTEKDTTISMVFP